MIKIACDANFLPTTDTSIETKESLRTVIIRRSCARMANMSVSLLEYEAEGAEIVHYNQYMIVSTLPFKTRALTFWNMAGVVIGNDVNAVSEKV
jgi:hypothetical protein